MSRIKYDAPLRLSIKTLFVIMDGEPLPYRRIGELMTELENLSLLISHTSPKDGMATELSMNL
jgi:hypothetical protein